MAKGFNIRAWLGLETRDFQQGLRKSAQQTQSLNKGLRNTGNFLNSIRLAIAGIGIAGMFGSIIKTISEFETKMARVKVISGATIREFAEMKKAARAFGRSTVYSATEVGDGLKYLAMAGLSARESLEALPAVLNLAYAGMVDMGTAADQATNLMNGFGYGVESLTAISDIMAHTQNSVNVNMQEFYETAKIIGPIFSSLGIGIEEAAVAIGLLGDAGIKGSTAGNAMSMSMSRLLRQPGEVQKVFSDLGVLVNSSTISVDGFIGTLRNLREARISTEQMAIVFGRHFKSIIPFITMTDFELEMLEEELANYKDAAAKVAEEGIGPLERSLKILRSVAQDLWIQWGEQGLSKIIQVFAERLKSLVDVIGKVTTWFTNLAKKIAAAKLVLAGVLIALGALIGPFTMTITIIALVIYHWNSLIDVLETVLNGIHYFVRDAVTFFYILLAGIGTAVKGIANLIAAILKTITDTAVQFVITLGKIFGRLGKLIWAKIKGDDDKVKQLWDEIKEAATDFVTGIADKAEEEFGKVKKAFKKDIDDIIEKFKDGLWEVKDLSLDKLKSKGLGIIPKREEDKPLGYQRGKIKPKPQLYRVDLIQQHVKGLIEDANAIKNLIEMHDKMADSIRRLQNGALRNLGSSFRRLATALGDSLSEAQAAWLDFIIRMAEGLREIITMWNDYIKAKELQGQIQIGINQGVAMSEGAAQTAAIPFGWLMIPAVIATIASMFAAIPSPRRMASGGLAFGRAFAEIGEYAGAGHNPEVIAPLSKLKEYLNLGGDVRFEIEGNKLIGVLNRQQQRNRRFK